VERQQKLESLLDEFNLHHVRKNNGDSLSGGERRRTEIARALAVDPKFILLDEPFAGVDPIAVEDIQSVVAKLKFKNIGILITDHNVNETLSICDRAYLLIDGKIFQHGTAEELADNEQVRRLYLGTNFELKRKDWIIEMGMNDSSIPNMIRALNSLHEHGERILLANLSAMIDVQPVSEKLEDVKADDYVSLYNATKRHLQKWAASITETDLQELINSLPDITMEDFAEPSFHFVHDIANDSRFFNMANHFKYEETNGKLQQLTSHLGIIKLRLTALANSKN